MEIQRTAVVKLSIPDERRDDLKRTMSTFRDAAQRFADRGWDGGTDGYVITSRSRLQPLVYDDIRDDTGLDSDLTVAAVNHATDALSQCVEKMKDGERTSKPVFTSNTTVYNTNSISYFNGYCSLATYGTGRVHAEYVYPENSPQSEYMDSDEWTKQGAKLRYDPQTDTYYLHVSVTQERRRVSGCHQHGSVHPERRPTESQTQRVRTPPRSTPTARHAKRTPHHRVDRGPVRPMVRGLRTPGVEAAGRRGRFAGLFGNRIRGFGTDTRASLERLEIPGVGVP
jgi:hypothetical protein